MNRDVSWLRDRRVVVLALGCGLVGFLLALLIFGSPWHLPPDWGDIPTWLAVVVASVGGWVALSQLRQQQKLIESDVERSRKRDALLDGQLAELADQQASRRRAQAEDVNVTWTNEPGSEVDSTVEVVNNSRRPIRNVTCTVNRVMLDEHPIEPHHSSEMTYWPNHGLWTIDDDERTEKTVWTLRAGTRAAFSFDVRESPEGCATVEFTDDAGNSWRLYHDMSLGQAPIR